MPSKLKSSPSHDLVEDKWRIILDNYKAETNPKKIKIWIKNLESARQEYYRHKGRNPIDLPEKFVKKYLQDQLTEIRRAHQNNKESFAKYLEQKLAEFRKRFAQSIGLEDL